MDGLPALEDQAQLDRLLVLEEQATTVLAGDTLLHGDLYPFNLLLTPDRVVAVDWPHAWIGAPFCDALTLMSSASLSGIDPQTLADRHPLTRDLDPRSVDVFLAVHAGFLFRVATNAGPATGPRLIAMMTRLGTASLSWLRRRW
ncbi:phosphotransferase [Actinoplanes sp. NPDC051411]|uniref:phosphotransferase n=1 Tax=Actinoplanes sp. NPDC051411 TaxID=3155522 RepID=UPI003437DC9D